MGAARVSLVKQRRGATSAQKATDDSEVEYLGANDELPTALMEVNGVQRRVAIEAPVDYAEGIGGFLLGVIGVCRFRFRSVFKECIEADACMAASCTDEFLLGIAFMRPRGATMDFEHNEGRYHDNGADGSQDTTPRARGDPGRGVSGGKGWRLWPISTYTLYRRRDAGGHGNYSTQWARLGAGDRQCGELEAERVKQWIDELGNSTTPLNNESDVHIGVDESNARVLVAKLLHVYRSLTANGRGCPPATTLDVEHHINTGDFGPILMKRRRQVQAEDQIIEENVTKMLQTGVIEEGNGAWGSQETKEGVYPLPRIDETLVALGDALLFTTLDLRAVYWQILVAPDDRNKTAFTTKKGLIVYFDAIGVFTRGGIERHKWTFATRFMEYLDHELSSDDVRPLERLVSAVWNFARPTDAVEAKRLCIWPATTASLWNVSGP
ncbi:hypothetical protein ON010_g15860 [Phytophthora cinnamomi]|nr:hypothetical protein ON010_g15860 [Phytophthora cinnamomi]